MRGMKRLINCYTYPDLEINKVVVVKLPEGASKHSAGFCYRSHYKRKNQRIFLRFLGGKIFIHRVV